MRHARHQSTTWVLAGITLLLFSGVTSGCSSKEKQCTAFIDRMKECSSAKEGKMSDEERTKVIEKCVENYEEAEDKIACLDEEDCAAFRKCTGFDEYVSKLDEAKAEELVRDLAVALVTYCQEEHVSPDGMEVTTGVFPKVATPACTAGGEGETAPGATDWSQEPWSTIHFELKEPHKYRYCFVSASQKAFAAWAELDTDGDGDFEERVCVTAHTANGYPEISVPNAIGDAPCDEPASK